MSWLPRCFVGIALSIAALFLSHAAVGQEAGQSVVVDLHFDEGEGRWAFDSSRAENSGMLGAMVIQDSADPRWVSNGKEGGALEFDGVNDVVMIAHTESLNFVRGIMVEAWIYQRARSPYARILDKGPCFDIYIHENGTPSFRFHGAEAHGVRGPDPITLNEWVHLKASYDGRTMALFVNGKEVASRPYNEPIPNRTNDLRVGSAQSGRFFNGMIDEVKVINIGYQIPVAAPYEPDADTVGLWHFDTADRAIDAGPNKLHGEIHGAELVPGKIGKALEFDGDGYVRIPYHPSMDLCNELTIDCWVKQMKRGGWSRIVEKDNWVYGLWIEKAGRADFFYHPATEGSSHTMSHKELPLFRWVHIRVEFDGLERVIYFDGEEVIRTPVEPDREKITTSTGDLFIGNNASLQRGFVGMLDELRLSRIVRTPRPPICFKVTPFPSDNIWEISVIARPLRRRTGSLHWNLKHLGNGKTYEDAEISEPPGGFAKTKVDISDMPAGDYLVSAVALDEKGNELARGEKKVTKPVKPKWLDAKTGITDEVLPPWTAVEVNECPEGVCVLCWGRSHIFGGCGWPRHITSLDGELLAAPVRLVIKTERGDLESSPGKLKIESAAPHEALLEGSGRVGDVDVATKVKIEYDGLIRFDIGLTPDKPVQIESAYLEIPLAARHATLMHHPMGKWFEDPTCAGAIPKERWSRPNAWFMWLGDEDRGLCWFAEDQDAWGLDYERPGIEVIPDGDVVRLRVWLINSSSELSGPREFTWGLIATPVKPMPEGWQRWRFGNPRGPVNVAVLWSTLKTSKWHSFPVPPDPAAYRAWVEEVHQEGKKFVPYTNFNMQSDTGPEWEYWGEEWSGYAGEGLAADVLAMNVVNIRCCAMTPSWCDFITHKYKRFLEEYDSDGFYLDNSKPYLCKNPDHPPRHHNRRHIFGARELMKRIYAVTKQNDPGNVMVCHMSACLCIPLLSFCDAIVDGEQYGWALKETFDGHYIPITPPDRVRAELMGRQWGLIPLFLPCNRGPNPWNEQLAREMFALLLPHGCRFWFGGHRPTMEKVLDVVDAFGIDKARFIPYWTQPPWRRLLDERKMLVTLYAREDELMLIASNLTNKAEELELSLDLPTLGALGSLSAVIDPLDNLPASLQGKTLRLTIGPRDMRILLIK